MRTDARWMRWGLPTGSRSNDTICDIMIDHRHKTNTRRRQLYILFRQQSICVAQSKDWKTTWPRIGKRIFESLCSYMKVPLDVADAVTSMFQQGTNMAIYDCPSTATKMYLWFQMSGCAFSDGASTAMNCWLHNNNKKNNNNKMNKNTKMIRTATNESVGNGRIQSGIVRKWNAILASFCFTTSMVSWSSCCYAKSMKVGSSLTWLSLITIP